MMPRCSRCSLGSRSGHAVLVGAAEQRETEAARFVAQMYAHSAQATVLYTASDMQGIAQALAALTASYGLADLVRWLSTYLTMYAKYCNSVRNTNLVHAHKVITFPRDKGGVCILLELQNMGVP